MIYPAKFQACTETKKHIYTDIYIYTSKTISSLTGNCLNTGISRKNQPGPPFDLDLAMPTYPWWMARSHKPRPPTDAFMMHSWLHDATIVLIYGSLIDDTWISGFHRKQIQDCPTSGSASSKRFGRTSRSHLLAGDLFSHHGCFNTKMI